MQIRLDIEYYHYDELEYTYRMLEYDPQTFKRDLKWALRYSGYTSEPYLLTGIKREKSGRYTISFKQSIRGSRTYEQVAMENERFHKAQELSKNADDMNEVYANLEYLKGKSI